MTQQTVWRRWHWIMTIAWPEGNYWEKAMANGSCAPKPDHTRQQMFDHFYDKVVRQSGSPEHAVVVFFALEPDELVPEE
ncbi:hypothetical protein ABZ835_37695 [Streptomyces sp. NPDC047461]|uniref:hypothetical protein n=1 Tax=Streptomyces sp. NPDC047461 TaxID=3155619 RepID=UPI0033E4A5DE